MTPETLTLERIAKLREFFGPRTYGCECMLSWDDMSALLSLAASALESRWVPTSERMPDAYQGALFVHVNIVCYGHLCCDDDGREYWVDPSNTDMMGDYNEIPLADVVAWRPLPLPPPPPPGKDGSHA